MDYVKFIKWEEHYPLYRNFIRKFKPDLGEFFIEESIPNEKSLFRVLFTAGHLEKPQEILHIIEDLETKQVYVVGKKGVRTATAVEIVEFEDYPSTLMYIYFDQYGEVRYNVERLHKNEDNPEYFAQTIIDEFNRNSWSQYELLEIKVIGRRLFAISVSELKDYFEERKFETVKLSYSDFMRDIEKQIQHYKKLVARPDARGYKIIEFGFIIRALESIWDDFVEDMEGYNGYTESQLDEMIGDLESMAELVSDNTYESMELTDWENDILIRVFG